MAYQEKNFQREFNKWCLYNLEDTSVFELKITKGKSLPFFSVKKHQVNALLAARRDKIIYKIPDDAYDQKPFDSFLIAHSFAYIVILFYKPYKTKIFYMIGIENWIKEVEKSKRKSITQDRSRELGREEILK